MAPVNALHAALMALHVKAFMDAKGWATHLSKAGVTCTAKDVTYAVFGTPGLKHVLGDAENAFGVYMRMTGCKKYYQILSGGPCDESLRGSEPPAPRRGALRDAALRREASAYILKEKNRRTRESSDRYIA